MATAPDGPTDAEPHAEPGNATDDATDETAERPRATRFVFVDTEATGLDHHRHEVTEIAWIVRFEDGSEVERRYYPEHTTDGADADALELTRYEERIAPQDKSPASEWLVTFLEDAKDAVLVGAVPDFDAKHLERMCRKLGLEPSWDHHLLDVETLALPFLAPGPEAPRSLAKTCAGLGIPHDKDQAHGALYDAQQAMRVFDRVWELVAELRATGSPLPPPVVLTADENEDSEEGGEPAGEDTETTATEASARPEGEAVDHAPSGADATSS